MDNDFEFGGRSFKLGKIDAIKQYHIVRRIAPILSDLLPALTKARGGAAITEAEVAALPETEKLELVAQFAGPIISGLSKLSDVDAEFVLFNLLTAVEMKQSTGNWAKISKGSMLMIQDLELPVLMHLAGRAFMFNLSGFFSVLPR